MAEPASTSSKWAETLYEFRACRERGRLPHCALVADGESDQEDGSAGLGGVGGRGEPLALESPGACRPGLVVFDEILRGEERRGHRALERSQVQCGLGNTSVREDPQRVTIFARCKYCVVLFTRSFRQGEV